jgi:hypothetical protein
MQKYALKTFDVFWNEFLPYLAINPMMQKNMQMQQLPSLIRNPYYLKNIFNILCKYIKFHIIYKNFFLYIWIQCSHFNIIPIY